MGVKLDGSGEMGYRVIVLFHIGERHAEVVVGVPVVGVEVKRLAVVGDCEIGITAVAICYAAIVVGDGVIGRQFDCLGVVADGEFVRTAVEVCVSAQEPGASIVRIGVDGVGEAVRYLSEMIHVTHRAQIWIVFPIHGFSLVWRNVRGKESLRPCHSR